MKEDVLEKLCKDFKISKETCTDYEQFFLNRIERNIKLRYLSHLVSTVEDMINDVYKQKYIIPVLNSDEYSSEQKRTFVRRNFRLYSILLRPLENLHCKGYATHHNFGSIIVYNPNYDDREIRILIAHELGHIINLFILRCDDTQNRANLFSFLAINGKDQHYKEGIKKYTYNSELEIIDSINSICPILEYNQLS